eukprot:2709999-Rhodomonas_salina.6
MKPHPPVKRILAGTKGVSCPLISPLTVSCTDILNRGAEKAGFLNRLSLPSQLSRWYGACPDSNKATNTRKLRHRSQRETPTAMFRCRIVSDAKPSFESKRGMQLAPFGTPRKREDRDISTEREG